MKKRLREGTFFDLLFGHFSVAKKIEICYCYENQKADQIEVPKVQLTSCLFQIYLSR